jgi:hypothetical protein
MRGNNLRVTVADAGRTIVITSRQNLDDRIIKFINDSKTDILQTTQHEKCITNSKQPQTMQRSIKPTKKETDHQGPDFDDLKISEK